jgi:predicted Zn-ribbon and HTH transcriptional regulator
MIKIWLFKQPETFLFNSIECTQKYVEEHYTLVASTNTDLKDWFQNFNINGQLYDTHAKTSYKDTNHEVKNIFASPYSIKSLKEVKEKPQIENMNNAICPVCGYVDYYSWEIDCPDENYKCPHCKSSLLLEHKFDYDYDGSATLYQRTTFKKIHHPKKIQATVGESYE